MREGLHNKEPSSRLVQLARITLHSPCLSSHRAAQLLPVSLPWEGMETRSRSPTARWSVSPARAVLNVTCSTSWGGEDRLSGHPSASWPSALSSGTYRAQWACGHAPVCDVVQAPSPPGLSPVASVGRACQVVVAPFLLFQGPEGGSVIKAQAPLCWRRRLGP